MKILVIQTAFIGDAVLTLPMIQKLKSLYPESIIDVVSTPASKEIFGASPNINNVFPYDKRNKQKSFWQLIKFSVFLKSQNYQKVFSPHRSFRTALIILLSGIKDSYGFSNSSLKKIYRHLIPYNSKVHEVIRNLNLIGIKEEIDLHEHLPIVNSSDEIKRIIQNEIDKINSNKIVAVAPGSVWETKKYPIENYKKIIEHLLAKNYKILLIGGKSDLKICEEISNSFNENVANFAGKFSIIESVELLRNCKLLICNDSAPTHFGMAAKIPVLTIYCSTIPEFGFYPYNKLSKYLSYDDLSCKPCGIHGHKKCPIGTFECAYKLDLNLIFNTIDEMLEKSEL